MDLKKRLDELSAAVDRLKKPENTTPPPVPHRMTAQEWVDFLAGKPTLFKIRTVVETAHYVSETTDGQLSLTRMGTDESDLDKVAEKIGNWVQPKDGFNPFCSNWNGLTAAARIQTDYQEDKDEPCN